MGDRAAEKKTRTIIDRLSDLPDNIIQEILSFLDTKHAIKTCVLSRRWRYLWTSVPDLRFRARNCSELFFSDFVRKFLSKREDCSVRSLELFSSHWGIDQRQVQDFSFVNDIVNYAVTHHVQDLLFDPACYESFTLPTCESLKTLYLSHSTFDDLPKPFCFALSNLTSMNLHRCCFSYQSDFGDPFASYSNLKNLSLSHCWFSSLKRLKITGIQLVSLEIRGFEYYCRYNKGLQNGCKVEISAPNLLSFIYIDSDPVDFSALHLPSLNYVEVGGWTCNPDHERSLYLINMFRGLGNAQHVRLHYTTIKILDSVDGLLAQQPSPFKRLKKMEVLFPFRSLKVPEYVRNYLLSGSLMEKIQYLEVLEN